MKSANRSRTTSPFRSCAVLVALFLFLVSPLAQRSGWCKDPDRGISLWPDVDGKNDHLSYVELVKLLNEYLKDAQQVNIYTDLCKGGALLTQAKELKMPYFVAVGETDAANCTVASTGVLTDEKPPGRLKIKIDKDTTLYFYSFADYLTATLKDADKVPTAKSLFDSTYKDVKEDSKTKGETPGFTSGNGAKPELAINGGAKSNHALLFNGDFRELNAEPALERYRVLAKKKYGFKQGDGTNSLQFYYYFWEPKKDYEGTKIDGMGTLANFKVALQNLQKLIKNNPKQEELVNIFFDGHGYETAAAAPRQPGLDGIAKDGFLVRGWNCGCLSVPTDLSFWHDLKVGIEPNDEGLVRVYPAEFVLYVSEASISSRVAVAINNLPLGYFDVTSTSAGGELRVPLPDWFVSDLLAESDGATSIDVSLALAPSDYLRIATEDDILLDPAYSEGDYGFGITTTIVGRGLQGN